jgi:hypothetical protein
MRKAMNEATIRHEGNFVLVETADGLLLFTEEEWSQAMRRGDSILRNRQDRNQRDTGTIKRRHGGGRYETSFRSFRCAAFPFDVHRFVHLFTKDERGQCDQANPGSKTLKGGSTALADRDLRLSTIQMGGVNHGG